MAKFKAAIINNDLLYSYVIDKNKKTSKFIYLVYRKVVVTVLTCQNLFYRRSEFHNPFKVNATAKPTISDFRLFWAIKKVVKVDFLSKEQPDISKNVFVDYWWVHYSRMYPVNADGNIMASVCLIMF